jgi:CheY-like chemotaxis protein
VRREAERIAGVTAPPKSVSPPFTNLLQEALEAQGYSVFGIAGTVAEAMKIARQHQPDVTISDVRLANGDLGTEFSPTFVRAMIALSCVPAGAPTTRYWPRPMAMP